MNMCTRDDRPQPLIPASQVESTTDSDTQIRELTDEVISLRAKLIVAETALQIKPEELRLAVDAAIELGELLKRYRTDVETD